MTSNNQAPFALKQKLAHALNLRLMANEQLSAISIEQLSSDIDCEHHLAVAIAANSYELFLFWFENEIAEILSALVADFSEDEEASVREKILEAIMTMLEAFADKRQILKPLHQWALREPKFGLALAQLAYQICDRILLISGDFPQDTLIANIRRSVRVKGIIALLIKIRAVWLQDQSDDMAPTFRALDSSMQQVCEWAESLRLFDNHSEEKNQT